ncbi:hypothetical protein QTO34_007812 [Cnephaeus nilssonii]|uniref:Uncharacterized protein n=1 Tax=Cnephaeus nilssonii TaxID=3371016 RepID=A0AA40HJ35_CNENI|nr:hypothetical protein QTO34_007812 [Eptesicus nilssonii]
MEENKRMDIEFKTTVIRFFKNFMEKADKFNETLEDMKKDQLEIKHTLTEIKNIIQRPNSRLEERKNQVKDLEYKEAKDTPEKQKEKGIQKVEDSGKSNATWSKEARIMAKTENQWRWEQEVSDLSRGAMSKFPPVLVPGAFVQRPWPGGACGPDGDPRRPLAGSPTETERSRGALADQGAACGRSPEGRARTGPKRSRCRRAWPPTARGWRVPSPLPVLGMSVPPGVHSRSHLRVQPGESIVVWLRPSGPSA